MKKQEQSWRALNRRLRTMTEDELQALIDAEIVGQRRVFVAERLHQRLSAVRASRERQQLMEQLHERDSGLPSPAANRSGDDSTA